MVRTCCCQNWWLPITVVWFRDWNNLLFHSAGSMAGSERHLNLWLYLLNATGKFGFIDREVCMWSGNWVIVTDQSRERCSNSLIRQAKTWQGKFFSRKDVFLFTCVHWGSVSPSHNLLVTASALFVGAISVNKKEWGLDLGWTLSWSLLVF